MLTRRGLLQTALASGVLALPAQTRTEPFAHRGYLGWITDLASAPDPHAEWPSMRVDAGLIRDYERTFQLMARLGFNEMTLWGLYVSQSWPVNIATAVTEERGKRVERILDAAHANGIRIYAGLGVYSWGFEEIIREHPKLAKGNPRAMCPDIPESWEWMRRVTDFVLTRFPVDGVSMQSADQGRCQCAGCAELIDAEYHGRLNIKVADYIRSEYPGKTVAVNGWGMNFSDPRSPDSIVRLSEHADYIIDVSNSVASKDPAQRTGVIQRSRCAWGTIGGPQVEPPQHWQRDRWFLPTVRRQSEHLQDLYRDGGRACEYFFHILANPGCELSFWMAGKVMSDPATHWRRHLRASVEEIYDVGGPLAERIESLMLGAEDAYFATAEFHSSETISMEPLVSNRPGPPIYLKRFPAWALTEYSRKMNGLRQQVADLQTGAGSNRKAASRLGFIERAIGAVVRDIVSLA